MEAPRKVAENYIAIGKKKAGTPFIHLGLLGGLAGIFIALAAVGANTASCTIADPSTAKLIASLVFPAGLAMVLLAGSELFTGDCLMVISALEKEISWCEMIKCWIVVYIGNLIGSLAVAFFIVKGNQLNLFSGALAVTTIKTAVAKTSLTFSSAFILGMFCNFLVCIAVWIYFAGTAVTEKLAGLFFPIMLFVLSGFEHSVANMYYIPAGIFAMNQPHYASAALQAGIDTTNLNWGSFLCSNLLPVTLGNIVGGSLLVGCVAWFLYLKKDKTIIEQTSESNSNKLN